MAHGAPLLVGEMTWQILSLDLYFEEGRSNVEADETNRIQPDRD